MSTKESYEKKLQAQLDEWSAEIDKLKAKANQAEADAEIDYNKQIDELESKRDQASQKLEEVKASSGDAWQDLKGGIEKAWDSLGQAVKSASNRFK